MRVLILALMILLLPVRGWLGDVMAMGSLQEVATSSAHADCVGHQPTESVTDSIPEFGPGAAEHGGCGQCKACDICHGVVVASSVTRLPASFGGQSYRPSALAFFASAEPILSDKPPIF